MTCLGERLDGTAGHIVFLGNAVDGNFVAQIAELEGKVEATIATGGVLFFVCGFLEDTAL